MFKNPFSVGGGTVVCRGVLFVFCCVDCVGGSYITNSFNSLELRDYL